MGEEDAGCRETGNEYSLGRGRIGHQECCARDACGRPSGRGAVPSGSSREAGRGLRARPDPESWGAGRRAGAPPARRAGGRTAAGLTFWSTMEQAISRTCARLKSPAESCSSSTGSRLRPICRWKEMPAAGAAAATGARKGAGPGPEPGTSAAAAAAATAATGSSGLGGRSAGGALIAARGARGSGRPRARSGGGKVCSRRGSRELRSPRPEAENENFPEKSPRAGAGPGPGLRSAEGGGKMAEREDGAAGSAGAARGGAA